ncbi:MAG: endopeptidase La [Bacilli bacterium]|nr:endopeptidase La [Bacilli bacterium]
MNNILPVIILKDLVLFPQQEVRIDLNNNNSKKTIDISKNDFNSKILVVCPKDNMEEDLDSNDLPNVGVIGDIYTMMELPNGTIRVTIKGVKRIAINNYFNDVDDKNILMADTYSITLPKYNELEEISYVRKLKNLISSYIEENPTVSNSIINTIKKVDNVNVLTDIIATFIPLKTSKKLDYMQEINGLKRATNILTDLEIEIQLIKLDQRLDDSLNEKLANTQREYIIKEKLNALKEELGEEDEKTKEIQKYFEQLESLNPKPKIYNQIVSEIKKYEFTTESSPETMSIRNYLDWVLNLPWNNKSDDEANLNKIRKELDKSHYGLKEIKERIVEYQAIKKFNQDINGPIICLVGPPGVGKTSIAKSIARSLNKKFFKISLGGMSDAAELNGHRRTYLGSQPGKIIKALKYCCTNNPVILLDEIDKMVITEKGDPSAVLLDILDHEQNTHFTDNYIDMPFDISDVTFILTANDINSIPGPLKDRLEIIELNSYTEYEKLDICKKYLIPKLLDSYLIDHKNLKIKDDAINIIIKNYTKEAGVRELSRLIDTVIRKAITQMVEDKITSKTVSKSDITLYLGNYRYDTHLVDDYVPGMVNILSYTPYGGLVNTLEVIKYSGTGKIVETGHLGDILKESIDIALNYIKANKKDFKLIKYNFDSYDYHINFLETAIKKDGPSAGVSIVSALLSLFLDHNIPKSVAMTGEISLHGNIMKVGGIKEKIIGAYNMGIKKVFIPKDNIFDLELLPKELLDDMEIVLVSNYSEIYQKLFKK